MKLLVSSKRLDHSQMTGNCVRKLRWKDDVNHCKSKSDQRCKVRRWYSVILLVFYTIHSLCLAMAERREEGREGRSAPSIALGSWGKAAYVSRQFQPNIQHHFCWNFYTAGRLHGGRVFSLDLILLRLSHVLQYMLLLSNVEMLLLVR